MLNSPWIRVRCLAVLAAMLPILSCADGIQAQAASAQGGVEGPVAPAALAASGASLLEQIRDAPFVVNYRGTRRVRLNYLRSDSVDYIEEVAADGLGQFSIEPMEVLGANPNADLVLALKSAHRVFDYRYRDFRVLDPALFDANYEWVLSEEQTSVVGRSCHHLIVPRLAPFQGGHYEADVDVETSLVLQWKEIDPAGTVLAHVAFDSIAFGADLSDVDLTSGLLTATELDISGDFSHDVSFQVLTPSLLPTGYQLASATVLELASEENSSDPNDVWLRQLFTDGLQRAWLLHGPQVQSNGEDMIYVYSDGAWTIAMGKFDGNQVFAVGHVSEDQLLDMLRSLQ